MENVTLGVGRGNNPQGPESSPPPTVPLDIVAMADGSLEVQSGTGLLSITLSNSGAHDGTYEVDTNELAAGPKILVPPSLVADTATAGDTITIEPGLWVFDPAFGEPEVN